MNKGFSREANVIAKNNFLIIKKRTRKDKT